MGKQTPSDPGHGAAWRTVCEAVECDEAWATDMTKAFYDRPLVVLGWSAHDAKEIAAGTYVVRGLEGKSTLPPEKFEVRSIQKFFTHRPVSTFDRVPFQLTGKLFLYGTTLRETCGTKSRASGRRTSRRTASASCDATRAGGRRAHLASLSCVMPALFTARASIL